MTDRSDCDTQIEALRARIRATGHRVRWVRVSIWVCMSLAITAVAIATHLIARTRGEELTAVQVLVLTVGCWLGVGISFLFALPIAAAGRRICCHLLQRVLAGTLTPAEQARVLLPMQTDPSPDTRRLVIPLLDDLHARTGGELVPASPPERTGSEATPA